jgi:hypothetical protein
VARESKAQPKAAPKAAPRKSGQHPQDPSARAAVRAILEDMVRPLTPADAAELFAANVINVTRVFDHFWFRLVVDLVMQVTDRCEEADVKATFTEIAGDVDGVRGHLIRRRINRNLPVAPGDSKLTETQRYELARAIVVSACDAVKSDELWDALWGRKAGWFPIITVDKEPGEDNAT